MCIFQNLQARLSCGISIHIVRRTIFWMIKLECCSMDEVGNHEDAVFLEHCVSWSVSISSNGLYASFQSVASLKEMQSVLVRFKHDLCLLAIVALHSLPCLCFHAVDINMSLRESHLTIFQQTSDVVEMKMRDVDQLQFPRSHSLFFQFWEKLTEWCTKSCIKQDILSFGLEKETAHTRRDSLQKPQGIPQRIRNIGIERKWLHVSPRLVLNPSDRSWLVVDNRFVALL